MKILLPVDGTELSLHETRFALHLVRQGLNASFVLANVQEPANFYEIVTAHDPALIEDVAMEAAEELMAPSARLLQEAGVPPWLRDNLPLLWVDGRLAWIAGVGVAAEFGCRPEETGLVFGWSGLG